MGRLAYVIQGPEGPVVEGLERAQAELGNHAIQRGMGAEFGERVELVHLLAPIRERGVVLGEQAAQGGTASAGSRADIRNRRRTNSLRTLNWSGGCASTGEVPRSIVGVKVTQRRPDLFCAYVGTGQITDMARNEAESYPRAWQRARASGSTKALRALEKAGPPPYPLARAWLIKQRWSFETDLELRA